MNGLVDQVQAAASDGGQAVWALALGVALALVAILGSGLLMVARRLQKLSDEQRTKLELRLQEGARTMTRTREELELAMRDSRASIHNVHALVTGLLNSIITRREFERADDERRQWEEWADEKLRMIDPLRSQVVRLANGAAVEKKP